MSCTKHSTSILGKKYSHATKGLNLHLTYIKLYKKVFFIIFCSLFSLQIDDNGVHTLWGDHVFSQRHIIVLCQQLKVVEYLFNVIDRSPILSNQNLKCRYIIIYMEIINHPLSSIVGPEYYRLIKLYSILLTLVQKLRQQVVAQW